MPALMNVNNIQPATPADFVELTAVWEASVRATHHFLKETDIAFFKPLVLNEFLHAVQCFCIKDNQGIIAGFSGTAAGKLEMLFVHPHFVGCGIGKALLLHALQKQHITKVDVNEQNKKAVDFYTHFGFVVVERMPADAMGKPYPILCMALPPVV